ncbi:DMT family transporter [Patescibacteria group bacterium]|nr:DMT family transporter [Patescibacteria group bacterium]
MSKKRTLAYLALLGNTLIWGLALPIVKKGFESGLTPTNFLLGRFFMATLFSLPIVIYLEVKHKQIRKHFTLKNILKIIPLELLGTFIALYLLYQGLNRTSAIESSLIAVTWPVLVTLGGVWFFKEKVEKHELLGLTLALAGTTLLVGEPLIRNHGFSGSLTGNLLILGQNLAIAAYYLLAKKHYAGINKWLVTHISFWIGLICFGAVALLSGESLMWQSGFWPTTAIIYMGVLGSILGLTLYLIGQDKIEASEASLFTYLQPIFAIPLAMILLSESIHLIEILAIAIIITGVYLAEKRGKIAPV